jgi:hypothetical protein
MAENNQLGTGLPAVWTKTFKTIYLILKVGVRWTCGRNVQKSSSLSTQDHDTIASPRALHGALHDALKILGNRASIFHVNSFSLPQQRGIVGYHKTTLPKSVYPKKAIGRRKPAFQTPSFFLGSVILVIVHRPVRNSAGSKHQPHGCVLDNSWGLGSGV